MQRSICVSGMHATIRVRGDLDATSVGQFEREVQELISSGAHTITIQLGELAFVDRAGQRIVAETSHRLDRLGGSLRLVRGRA